MYLQQVIDHHDQMQESQLLRRFAVTNEDGGPGPAQVVVIERAHAAEGGRVVVYPVFLLYCFILLVEVWVS
jgi:hypothetical protein